MPFVTFKCRVSFFRVSIRVGSCLFDDFVGYDSCIDLFIVLGWDWTNAISQCLWMLICCGQERMRSRFLQLYSNLWQPTFGLHDWMGFMLRYLQLSKTTKFFQWERQNQSTSSILASSSSSSSAVAATTGATTGAGACAGSGTGAAVVNATNPAAATACIVCCFVSCFLSFSALSGSSPPNNLRTFGPFCNDDDVMNNVANVKDNNSFNIVLNEAVVLCFVSCLVLSVWKNVR